jgi:hypothetical protein
VNRFWMRLMEFPASGARKGPLMMPPSPGPPMPKYPFVAEYRPPGKCTPER